ncbi:MAG: hypothetical protein Q8S73_41090 [Deltaproteobacteria bacterium]|nr:hypothetical protein [Myxococcales bacterium]MDP3220560.1 hypothetical protein [Deltaproteobacteria bacterium]
MRGFALVGAARPIVATPTTVRDRRARLWLVVVFGWARLAHGLPACVEPMRTLLWRLLRTLDRTVERARFDGDAVDVERAAAWRDALGEGLGPVMPLSTAAVLWAAVSTWDDAAAEQRARRERGGVPWEAYARDAQAVAEALDAALGAEAAAEDPGVVQVDVSGASMLLRAWMDEHEARLWGRAAP